MTMTAEIPQPIDRTSLPIRDLAKQARDELEQIMQEVKNNNQPLPRALANIALIDQIRREPAIQAFLEKSSQTVTLLRKGFLEQGARLSISSTGYKIFWHQGNSVFENIDGESLALIQSGRFPGSAGLGSYLVSDLANLKPEQILNQFKRGLSSPVNVG